MKKVLYPSVVSVLFLSVLLISSCSKVTTVNGLVASQTEVYTVNGSSTTTTTTFTYNSYNQQIESKTNSDTPTITTYPSFYSVIQTTGVSVHSYSLDAGQARGDNAGNSYVYDSLGYLSQVISAYTATFNTIVNGNTTKSVTFEPGDTITTVYTYTTKPNYWNYGINFLGKPNQNLISSRTVTEGTNVTPYSYAYTYDGQGRVKTMTITQVGITDTYTYTYTTN